MVSDKMALRQRYLVLLLAAFGCLLSVGCDGRPKRVQTSGQVLIDGAPLTQGVIQFLPEGTRPSTGVIDEDGHFTMTCYGDEDGVIPGTHRVSIIASEILSPTKIKWLAPKKYADPNTSGLTVTVDKKQEDLVIEITWDGGKPFVEGSGRSTFEAGDDV